MWFMAGNNAHPLIFPDLAGNALGIYARGYSIFTQDSADICMCDPRILLLSSLHLIHVTVQQAYPHRKRDSRPAICADLLGVPGACAYPPVIYLPLTIFSLISTPCPPWISSDHIHGFQYGDAIPYSITWPSFNEKWVLHYEYAKHSH